jgi:hypothetical protein
MEEGRRGRSGRSGRGAAECQLNAPFLEGPVKPCRSERGALHPCLRRPMTCRTVQKSTKGSSHRRKIYSGEGFASEERNPPPPLPPSPSSAPRPLQTPTFCAFPAEQAMEPCLRPSLAQSSARIPHLGVN